MPLFAPLVRKSKPYIFRSLCKIVLIFCTNRQNFWSIFQPIPDCLPSVSCSRALPTLTALIFKRMIAGEILNPIDLKFRIGCLRDPLNILGMDSFIYQLLGWQNNESSIMSPLEMESFPSHYGICNLEKCPLHYVC